MFNAIGINTNIFETNLINLSIVVAVVVVLGGDALRELLTKRRLNVLSNFETANNRYKAAQAELDAAASNLEQQKELARILCTETAPQQAAREKVRIEEMTLSEISRLEERNGADLELARTQASSFVYQSVMQACLTKATADINAMYADSTSNQVKQTMANSMADLSRMQNVESGNSIKSGVSTNKNVVLA